MRLDRLPACGAWLLAACTAGAFAQPAPAVRGGPAPTTLPAPVPAQASPSAQPPVQPIIIYSKEYIGSHEPGPQDPQAARQEAGAALAEARTRCRQERDSSTRNQCLQQAEDRYRAALSGQVR